jgi:hypothetical protein
MKRFFGLFLLTFLFVSTNARADLLLEPVVGWNFNFSGEREQGKVKGGGTIGKDDFSGGMGPAYGGRLGFQKMGFQVGLDYLHSSINPDDKEFKGSLNSDEWAAFVGFEFPVLFRVYGGYIFSATADGKVKDDSGNAMKADFKSGTGFKAGLGFTLLPFLDINLEYRRGTFSEYKLGSFDVEGDVNYNVYMIGLSLPFTL